MITTKEALQRFEETATHYIHELDQFSLEQLRDKQSDNEWSIGQMFQHLIRSALDMQLRNIDQSLIPSQDPLISPTEKPRLVQLYLLKEASRPFVFMFRLPLNIRQSSRKTKSSSFKAYRLSSRE